MDIIMIQDNLIDMIRQTTDLKKLVEMSEAMNNIVTGDKIVGDKIITKTLEETIVEKPRKEIPVAEIKKGVTLEEIKASQNTKPKDYDKIVEMFADEEWEQSLEELLESVD